MAKHIQDAFTDMAISRQRRYQLRKEAQGVCPLCSEPLATEHFCLKHAVYQREAARKKLGSVKRYRSQTYALEAKAAVRPSRRAAKAC